MNIFFHSDAENGKVEGGKLFWHCFFPKYVMAHFIPWEDISLNEDPGDEKLWLTKLHFGLFFLTNKNRENMP